MIVLVLSFLRLCLNVPISISHLTSKLALHPEVDLCKTALSLSLNILAKLYSELCCYLANFFPCLFLSFSILSNAYSNNTQF